MAIHDRLRTHIGRVPNPLSKKTKEMRARIDDADVGVSVCPYCAVGCSQLVYTRDGRVIDIEGNPDSPINAGTLCPKGAATSGFINSPHRLTTVKYRAPYSDNWEEKPLDWAMEQIARRVKQTRDETFVERDDDGYIVNRTAGIGHIGGATLDNEENYIIKKVLTGGLGIVAVENQARI